MVDTSSTFSVQLTNRLLEVCPPPGHKHAPAMKATAPVIIGLLRQMFVTFSMFRTSLQSFSPYSPQRPLVPLKLQLPEVFRKPASESSDAHVSAHRPTSSCNGPPLARPAVQPQVFVPPAASLPFEGRQHGEWRMTADQKPPTKYSGISESSTLSQDSSLEYPRPDHSGSISTAPERPPLLKGELALTRRTICHSARAQKLMERLKISWGVQFELARGVLEEKWTWDHVLTKLERLQGPNVEAAPRVPTIMLESMGGGSAARRAVSKVTNLDLWWV